MLGKVLDRVRDAVVAHRERERCIAFLRKRARELLQVSEAAGDIESMRFYAANAATIAEMARELTRGEACGPGIVVSPHADVYSYRRAARTLIG